jgi:hypothetical protein
VPKSVEPSGLATCCSSNLIGKLVERSSEKAGVGGSIPSLATILLPS